MWYLGISGGTWSPVQRWELLRATRLSLGISQSLSVISPECILETRVPSERGRMAVASWFYLIDMWVEFMTDFLVSEEKQIPFSSLPKILKKEGSWGRCENRIAP